MKTKILKKILIALDYNPSAQKVAEEGFSLAKSLDAEPVLIHVLSDPIYYSSVKHVTIMGFAGFHEIYPTQADEIELLKKESKLFLDKSKQHLGDETIHTIVQEGEFSDAILKTAKDIKADIIVMGSHSRKWMEKIIMGSVTEKVLSKTSIPLYIIPIKKHDSFQDESETENARA